MPASCDSIRFKQFRHEENGDKMGTRAIRVQQKVERLVQKQTCRGRNSRWSPSFREAWALIWVSNRPAGFVSSLASRKNTLSAKPFERTTGQADSIPNSRFLKAT